MHFRFRIRHNQLVLDQESQLNAPDPRETNPPCYADAIRMPRLDTSFISLKRESFASSDSVNSIRRAFKRSRSRSEEVLNVNGMRRQILVARSRKNISSGWDDNQGESSVSNVDLANNNLARANAPNQHSFEIIEQLETEDGQSPYAKRRPQINTTSLALALADIDSSSESLNHQDVTDTPISLRFASIQNQYSSDDYLEAGESSQASQSLVTSNEALDSTSPSISQSSSFEFESYMRMPSQSHSLKHSDV